MHINVNVCVCNCVCVYIWQPCTLYAGLKDLQTSPKAKQNDCDSLQPAVYLPPVYLTTLPFPLVSNPTIFGRLVYLQLACLSGLSLIAFGHGNPTTETTLTLVIRK